MGLILGQTDRPLNTTGKKQAAALKAQFKNIHFDVVYSSDLKRADKTAKILAGGKKIIVKTIKDLREQSFGRYEGMKREEFRKLFKNWEKMTDLERHTHTLSEDMESNEKAFNRFISVIKKIIKSDTGKTVLIVCHGSLMRYLTIHLNYSGYDYMSYFDNTGFIKLESDGVNFFIKELRGFHKP